MMIKKYDLRMTGLLTLLSVILSVFFVREKILLDFNNRAEIFYHSVNYLYQDLLILRLDDLDDLDGTYVNEVARPQIENFQLLNFKYDGLNGSLIDSRVVSAFRNARLAAYFILINNEYISTIYAYTHDYKLIGFTENNNKLPSKIETLDKDYKLSGVWKNFFCKEDEKVCSFQPILSNVYHDSVTLLDTITLTMPYSYGARLHGVLNVDLKVDFLFKKFYEYEEFNNVGSKQFLNVYSANEAGFCAKKTSLFCFEKRIELFGKKFDLIWDFKQLKLITELLFSFDFWGRFFLILGALSLLNYSVNLLVSSVSKDKLTGLPRRPNNIKVKKIKYDYMLVLDLDNFKGVNDFYGHNVGDLVLVNFTRHLEKHKRKVDVLYRWGGEEFVLLFCGVKDRKSMENIASRLLYEPLRIDEYDLKVTFSGGLVRSSGDLSVDFELADSLLYEVKRLGKDDILASINDDVFTSIRRRRVVDVEIGM